jgi:glycine cleavage system H protein
MNIKEVSDMGKENPEGLRYTKEHEWVKIEGDIGTVGITDFAQHQLTDIVFVELPHVGKKAEQMKPIAVVESVKSVSDVFAPVSGEVVGVNEDLKKTPETVNKDPFKEGWMFKIRISNRKELEKLMTKGQYDEFIKKGAHR